MADRLSNLRSWSPGSSLGGRVRRAATPAVLIAKGARAAANAQARGMRGEGDVGLDAGVTAVAEEIARSLGEMKGAAMKIGQALSFVDLTLLPEEFRAALAMLQADAPAMPYKQVERVVRDELGAPPDEVFDWFSPKPIAAASIGQVHMAHVGDREVVVKVQYPGVARAVEADLRNVALMSGVARVGQRVLSGVIKDLGAIDIAGLVDEIRARIGDELDYRTEAANQQAFAALYPDDPTIAIPEVVPELSTRRVLTMEYVDAMRWKAALDAPQELRDLWGETIARFLYTSMCRHGIVNVDTHPGNYLFHTDGRVSFLDFGCVSRFADPQRDRIRRVLVALSADDEDAILESLVAMGMLRNANGFNPRILVEPLRLVYQPIRASQPFTYSSAFVSEVLLRLRVGIEELKLIPKVNCPPEYVMLGRVTPGLESVLASLEATVDYDRVFAAAGLGERAADADA